MTDDRVLQLRAAFDTLRKLAAVLEVTTDSLLGRVDDTGLSEVANQLYLDVLGMLTAADRELAIDFIKMLAKRMRAEKKG